MASPGPGGAAAVDLTARLLALPQDDRAGWRALAALWGVDAGPLTAPDTCQALRGRGLRCYRSAASTLAQLQQLDRPGLLLLHLPGGAPRVARLVALGPGQVVLAGDLADDLAGDPAGTLPGNQPGDRLGNPRGDRPGASAGERSGARSGDPPLLRLPRAELARWWRGEFATLWRPPPGYADVLQPGASGPAVDVLARGLAQLDQQAPPVPGQALAGALAARLAGFQVAQSLRPDGLAGPTTFMHLNRATGVAEPRLRVAPLER